MERKELLAALRAVAPCVGDGKMIPATAFAAFVDGKVAAFSERLGAEVDFDSGGLSGAFPFAELHGFLAASSAKEVEIADNGASWGVAAGRSVQQLVRKEIDDWPFPYEFGEADPFAPSPDFLAALSSLVKIPVDDPSGQDVSGVAVLRAGRGRRRLVAATRNRLGAWEFDETGALAAFLLPLRFAQIAVKAAAQFKPKSFAVRGSEFVAFDCEGARFYSRSVAPNKGKLGGACDKSFPADADWSPIPEGFAGALAEVASTLSEYKQSRVVRFDFAPGVLTLATERESGETTATLANPSGVVAAFGVAADDLQVALDACGATEFGANEFAFRVRGPSGIVCAVAFAR